MTNGALLTEEEARQSTRLTSQGLVTLSDRDIATTVETIAQAEKLVETVLEPDIDYGLHPGTNSMAVKDSGSAKITNAFNTYPEHTILHVTERDDMLSYLVQAKLVHRLSGAVVGSGVGACSTKESKYAYRWVKNPEEYGFDKKSLKYNKENKKYRIPNPEIEDLDNTILKMASKRAELDAANSLPGVASGLKKLFQGKGQDKDKEGPRWTAFWSEVSTLGMGEDTVHSLLGVKSMKDWLSKGKSLNQAVEILAKYKNSEIQSQQPQETEGQQGEETELPHIDDARLQGWQIARQRASELSITDKQIRDWFAHYQLEVGKADFAKALPREDITNEMLSNLVSMLDAYKEKRTVEKNQSNILD